MTFPLETQWAVMTIFFCIPHHWLPGYCLSLDIFSPKPYSDQELSGWSSPSPPLPASEKSPYEQQQLQQTVFFQALVVLIDHKVEK